MPELDLPHDIRPEHVRLFRAILVDEGLGDDRCALFGRQAGKLGWVHAGDEGSSEIDRQVRLVVGGEIERMRSLGGTIEQSDESVARQGFQEWVRKSGLDVDGPETESKGRGRRMRNNVQELRINTSRPHHSIIVLRADAFSHVPL